METTLNIVSIIIIVFGILQIILFFKIWGMTDDVKEIKNMMKQFLKKSPQSEKDYTEPTILDDYTSKTPKEIVIEKKNKENPAKFTWQSWIAIIIIILVTIIILFYK